MNFADNNRILFFGYGNPSRGDDGLGIAFVKRVRSMNWRDVDTDCDYQLHIELSWDMQNYDTVVFVDATIDTEEPFIIRKVQPKKDVAFTSHCVSPESILTLAEDYFGKVPESWILGIRGYEFDLREGLSPNAERNLHHAWEFVYEKLNKQRSPHYGTEKSYINY